MGSVSSIRTYSIYIEASIYWYFYKRKHFIGLSLPGYLRTSYPCYWLLKFVFFMCKKHLSNSLFLLSLFIFFWGGRVKGAGRLSKWIKKCETMGFD